MRLRRVERGHLLEHAEHRLPIALGERALYQRGHCLLVRLDARRKPECRSAADNEVSRALLEGLSTEGPNEARKGLEIRMRVCERPARNGIAAEGQYDRRDALIDLRWRSGSHVTFVHGGLVSPSSQAKM